MAERVLHPFCATVVATRKEAGIPEYASQTPDGARFVRGNKGRTNVGKVSAHRLRCQHGIACCNGTR